MDENNNLNGTDENQSQDGYTGEYGNSVEGDGNTLFFQTMGLRKTFTWYFRMYKYFY